jgi:uncharacterized damage-inducible protein DinB
MNVEQNFLEYAAKKLEQLSGRIPVVLDTLTDEQIWFRAGDNSNAPGNLVLHLCGNVRQWIIAGVGGQPFERDRDAEFSAQGGLVRNELKNRLAETAAEALAVIRAVPYSRLTEKITVQGYEVTVLEAIFHVIEHFSGHTGQLIFIGKSLTERDFGFYSYLSQKTFRPGQKVP